MRRAAAPHARCRRRAAVTNANAAPQQTGSTLEDAPMTPEQQMDAIRRRIEQRRAQLRAGSAAATTAQKTPAQ